MTTTESAKKAIEETIAACRANRCPRCGDSVHHNFAITGWVQCDQFGSVGFRKDDDRPKCSWQGFVC